MPVEGALVTATVATTSLIGRLTTPLCIAVVVIAVYLSSGIFSPEQVGNVEELNNLFTTLTNQYNTLVPQFNEIESSLRNTISEIKSNNLTSEDYSKVLTLYDTATNYGNNLKDLFDRLGYILRNLNAMRGSNPNPDLDRLYNITESLNTEVLNTLAPIMTKLGELESILQELNPNFHPYPFRR
uniref:Uncharacterized protein n=1 Tax=Madurella mycetomatis TaxID=100816 RepID=J3JRF3_9PEZI|nr:hypothetical protein B662_mgp12 [Madurella mycetomatis]AEY94403.1 hypothetical protein [Madurella mycetomatis]